jgi:hypothetical protein
MKLVYVACYSLVLVVFVFGLQYVFVIGYGTAGIVGLIALFSIYSAIAATLLTTLWRKVFSN